MNISTMHFAKLGMKPPTWKKVSGKMLDELDADNIAKLQEPSRPCTIQDMSSIL
jgi:hypothetical protein